LEGYLKMDNEERIMAAIPKLYKRTALDLLMFGFVNGMKTALPSMTTKACLAMFQKKIILTEDEYPLDCARVTYQRMQNEYIDLKKTKD
jgi:hypothetical protein